MDELENGTVLAKRMREAAAARLAYCRERKAKLVAQMAEIDRQRRALRGASRWQDRERSEILLQIREHVRCLIHLWGQEIAELNRALTGGSVRAEWIIPMSIAEVTPLGGPTMRTVTEAAPVGTSSEEPGDNRGNVAGANEITWKPGVRRQGGAS